MRITKEQKCNEIKKTTVTYRCDNCGKQADMVDEYDWKDKLKYQIWAHDRLGNPYMIEDSHYWHFCNEKCLKEWLLKRPVKHDELGRDTWFIGCDEKTNLDMLLRWEGFDVERK